MKLICALVLWQILLQVSTGSTLQTRSYSKQECSAMALDLTKPMLRYLKKVTQNIDKQSEEIEGKNSQIDILEEKEFDIKREIENMKNQMQNLEEKHILHLRELDSKNKQIVHLQEMEIAYQRELKFWINKSGKLQIQNKIYKSKDDSMATVLNEFKRQQTRIEQLATNQCQREKKEIEQLKSQITSNGEAELPSHKKMIDEKDHENKELEEKVKELTVKEEDKKPKSCIGRGSAGVEVVTLSKGLTFEVLCNSYIAGPGWTVIQQRIDGKVDFYRDWNTYRDGFGDFWDGEFFLGLEKIHRLTAEEPHELYIYMERFNGSSYYARYDEFAIAGEEDQYKPIKLGAFSGSTEDDMMREHENIKFSTYDRDNDAYGGNCAEIFHGGWWYRSCALTNLNGIYYKTEVINEDSIYWEYNTSLKQVKMMIRPKETSK